MANLRRFPANRAAVRHKQTPESVEPTSEEVSLYPDFPKDQGAIPKTDPRYGVEEELKRLQFQRIVDFFIVITAKKIRNPCFYLKNKGF